MLWSTIPENFPLKQLLSGAVEGGQEEAVKFFEAWKAQVGTISRLYHFQVIKEPSVHTKVIKEPFAQR